MSNITQMEIARIIGERKPVILSTGATAARTCRPTPTRISRIHRAPAGGADRRRGGAGNRVLPPHAGQHAQRLSAKVAGTRVRTAEPDHLTPAGLFLRPVPGENLIENDGTERGGADSAHGEVAELKRQIAGTGGERRSDSNQISWV
jgi:hypothetical protein